VASLKEEALNYKLHCVDCGVNLRDYRSLRCRGCYNNMLKIKGGKKRFGVENSKWKGNDVGYRALHYWVRRHKPQTPCVICNSDKNLQISNISGIYKRDILDYRWLCASCHVRVDGTINNLNTKQGGQS